MDNSSLLRVFKRGHRNRKGNAREEEGILEEHNFRPRSFESNGIAWSYCSAFSVFSVKFCVCENNLTSFDFKCLYRFLWLVLGLRTCDVFLCCAALVVLLFFVFAIFVVFVLRATVHFTGFYTEDYPFL